MKAGRLSPVRAERDFFIDNLLVRIHLGQDEPASG